MLPTHRNATHPGKILLQEFLEPLGMSQAELSRALSIPVNRINELVRGKRGVTPETALLLAAYFKNSAEFWMNLQTAYDLTRTLHEMRKRPAVAPRGTRRAMGAD
ncbi:MAG: HigA family addiction module antitoxin [Candidatus Sulfotelmatobacter sp.]|jgi:addiction module HigA family antidote